MSHVHVDQEAVLRLREEARMLKRRDPGVAASLAELADQFAATIEDRDALQANVDRAKDVAERMAGGVWGYEGNKVAEAIQEVLGE
jgi:hypothetical protein